jgi:hypothetical protein
MLSEQERAERARIAAFARHAGHDPQEATQAARDARWAAYHRKVDPDGVLTPEERHRRARSAMRADLARISFDAAKRRREEADQHIVDQIPEAVS